MKMRGLALLFCLLLGSAQAVNAQTKSSSATSKEIPMTNHANGPFDVKTTPLKDDSGDTAIGRLDLDKQYHGDLEAVSKGMMLTAGSYAKGSAGYVAMEQVTGKLKDRTGGFALQHSGSMNGGANQLVITIVPGSGTGQLEGIAGTMSIAIAAGKHSYELEYTLPKSE